MNPAHDGHKVATEKDVATCGSIAGPTTGPKSGELLTTNENAERVGSESERRREPDAKLARIVAAWDELPAELKGAMLAIVDSASREREHQRGC